MILIASSSQILCRRWRNALAGDFPVHQVADRQSLMFALREYRPTIVFLDHTGHHFGPSRFICSLIKSAGRSKIVVVTKELNSTEALKLIRAGAKGYCVSSIAAPLICKAARVVTSGESWIGRKLLPVLLDEFVRTVNTTPILRETTAPNAFVGLSPREREITSLVASGQQNKYISN